MVKPAERDGDFPPMVATPRAGALPPEVVGKMLEQAGWNAAVLDLAARPSSEPGERARALEEAARLVDEACSEPGLINDEPPSMLAPLDLVDRIRALAAAPASSPGAGEEGLRARVEAYLAARDAWFAFIHDKSTPRNDAEMDRLGDEHDAALKALRTALSGRADATKGG